MAAWTRSARSALTKRVPLMTCETVAIDTFATRATSFIVAIATDLSHQSRKRLRHPGRGVCGRQAISDPSLAMTDVNVYRRRPMGDITFEAVWKVYPDGTQAVRSVD